MPCTPWAWCELGQERWDEAAIYLEQSLAC